MPPPPRRPDAKRGEIGDVDPVEGEARPLLEPVQPMFLQPLIVGIVDAIDSDYGVAVLKKERTNPRRDKARRPCYQNFRHSVAIALRTIRECVQRKCRTLGQLRPGLR